jgi:hypothetical protein
MIDALLQEWQKIAVASNAANECLPLVLYGAEKAHAKALYHPSDYAPQTRLVASVQLYRRCFDHRANCICRTQGTQSQMAFLEGPVQIVWSSGNI